MMKGSPKCAQIMFNASDSVRSSLATEALKRVAELEKILQCKTTEGK